MLPDGADARSCACTRDRRLGRGRPSCWRLGVEVVADPTLDLHDAVVETATTAIDLRVARRSTGCGRCSDEHPDARPPQRGARRRLAPRLGRVSGLLGLRVTVSGLSAALGDLLEVRGAAGPVPGRGRRQRGRRARLPAPRQTTGLRVGDHVEATGPACGSPSATSCAAGSLDGLGRPHRRRTVPRPPASRSSSTTRPPHALPRPRIDRQLSLGVRAMDALTPCGRGQRLGIMAGSGVGKSSLLSMIARGTDAEISVIALIGERGREVREFLENDLGPEGLARSVVVVATSDEPPVVRLRAAFVATRIAEWFRDAGRHVVLMMDSLTRVALAQREIGLSAGEPPATRGFPPSVFAMLPRLLERAGTSPAGSITGLYTVLVEGDDMQDPIGDSARSILDGHVVLTRELATSGHFPSIDVLESISRVVARRDHRPSSAGRRRGCVGCWPPTAT